MNYDDIKNRPTLVVRKIPFDFSEDIKPIWNAAKHEWSHMVNGASLAMPYLEPFLIQTVREANQHVTIDALKNEARGFVSQEAQHYQNHQRYNHVLKANGYAELAEVEETMAADYAQLQKKSLQWRLAYTAGFETMTMGLTEWLINDRKSLFGGADASVASLVLWHMVEETEHKNVAFDVYQHLYPKGYWMRLYGLYKGSQHVAALTRRGYISMLKKDGLWNRFSSRLKVYAMVLRFIRKVSPAMLRAVLPNYHPAKVRDPKWVDQWVNTYAALPENQIPLLDTNDPEIPPQFV